MASLDRYNDAAKVTARIAQALDAKVAAVKVHEFDLDVIEAARKVVGPQPALRRRLQQCPHAGGRSGAAWRAGRRSIFCGWKIRCGRPKPCSISRRFPRIMVGLGADLGSAEQLAVYAKAPSVGVLQPDICMIGGVSETQARDGVARAARRVDRPPYAFHRPGRARDPAFLATMKEVAYFAVIEAEPHMDMYGDSGFTRWQPDLSVPTGPGLGFDPDPEYLERYAATV